ncbi:hypothetical protein ADK93_00540 [Streptomyces sp. XY58]|nr:hypothetical protein ADK93_00540 [Streptomyces sp. XY58]KOV43093.1 hypothetical protein ADK99_29240 [Streptomyces sp. MMG1064]
MAPVAPVAPVAPSWPSSPGSPCGPRGPVGPVGPRLPSHSSPPRGPAWAPTALGSQVESSSTLQSPPPAGLAVRTVSAAWTVCAVANAGLAMPATTRARDASAPPFTTALRRRATGPRADLFLLTGLIYAAPSRNRIERCAIGPGGPPRP